MNLVQDDLCFPPLPRPTLECAHGKDLVIAKTKRAKVNW